MKTKSKTIAIIGAALFVTSQLTGCAAISTAIHHGSLKTSSKMSKTIFLDPVSDENKKIYVQVKDTSGKDVNLKDALVAQLKGEGWDIVHDLGKANDMVQVNVLQAGEAQSPEAVWRSMNGGFGSVLLGGLAGVAAGYSSDSVGTGLAVGGVVSGVSWLADQMYSDVTYSMITDIQVSIRAKDGQVTQTTQSDLSQGSQTNMKQTYNQKTDWIRYRARIASVADQANLKFDDAKPELVSGITKQIAGIFAG